MKPVAIKSTVVHAVKFSAPGGKWCFVVPHGKSPLDPDAAIDFGSIDAARERAQAMMGPRSGVNAKAVTLHRKEPA